MEVKWVGAEPPKRSGKIRVRAPAWGKDPRSRARDKLPRGRRAFGALGPEP